ncbi:MAG: PAS domain S-box protein [Acidobacteriales bacterium]|nr:MAG: PAS domain S-box protein [Terriglobales bacterium]
MKPYPVTILLVEDDPADAELNVIELKKAGIQATVDVASTRGGFIEKLHSHSYDLVLSDYAMVSWDGLEALDILRRDELDIPFILVTGALGEERVVECFARGVTDVVFKDRLGRLASAVTRALREGTVRKERALAEEALRKSEEKYRTIIETALEGIWVIDENDMTTFVNAEMARMLHLTVEQMTGRPFYDFLDQRPTGVTAAVERHRRGIADRADLCLQRADGSPLWAMFRATPMFGEDGQYRGAIAMFTDITERKQSEAALLRYKQDLQDLTARLISVQEEESRRLAVDLHDDLAQELAGLGLEAGSLIKRASRPDSQFHSQLREFGDRIRALSGRVHALARQLHPAILHDLGLAAALENECRMFGERYDIPAKFSAKDLPEKFPTEISLCLYRIAQEVLRNVSRHAKARHVQVNLELSGQELVLSMEDDGQGFDTDAARLAGRLGLVGMHERARLVNGTVTIRSQPQQGTVVEIRAPCVFAVETMAG